MAQYSVDLSINTKGYTDGIEEAKQSNAQFDSSVIKTDKSLASLKKEVGQARRAVENLAFAYAKMSKAEQQSGAGKALKRQLDEAKKYAADLKDLAEDVNNEIKNMASDTAGWDAMKQGIGIAKDSLSALATVVGDVTGNEDAFKDVLMQVARIQTVCNAAITIGNALQKQSALMVGIRKIQEAALAKAIDAETAATGRATIAQKVFNAVAKANPYVILATAIIAVGSALAAYVYFNKKATQEDDLRKKKLEEAKKAQESYNQTMSNSFGNLMSKYSQLKIAWEQLSSAQKKNKWIKENKNEFEQLGLKINNVADAENAFEKNTAAVIDGFRKRAEAAAVAAQMVEVYTKQLQLESKYLDYYNQNKVKAGDIDRSKSHTRDEGENTYNNGTSVYNEKTGNFEYTAKGAAKVNEEILKTDKTLKNINDEYQENNKQIDRLTEKAAELSKYTGKTTIKGDTNGKEVKYAKESLSALEKKLSDLQSKYKDGLLPNLSKADYIKQVEDLKKQIETKKIELGLELPPTELDEIEKKIKTLKANQLRVETRLDPEQYKAELKKLNDEKQRIEVEAGILVEPKINTNDANEVDKIMKDLFKPKDIDLDFSALKSKLPEELGNQVQQTVNRYEEVKDARQKLIDIINDEGSSDAAIADAQEGLEKLDDEWKKLTDDVTLYAAANKEVAKTQKRMQQLSTTVQGVGNAVQAAGQLFSALGDTSEDNEMKAVGIVAQAIATIALSFAQALTTAKTWVDWLAFGVTGLATMTTMIAQVKQLNAGSYADGGIVGGHSYYGDKLFARVNSNEAIFNTEQQKRLLDQLDNKKLVAVGQPQTVTVEGVIHGKDLLLVQRNYNSIGSKSGQSIQI